MRVATLVGAALTLAAANVYAGDIDKDNFTMDGVATYCQGVVPGAATFAKLESNSLNRCPILVNITPGATKIHKNEPLEVKFKATAKFGDIPGNIFPRAITDQNAKKILPVTSSFVRWCKAGTNCDKISDGGKVGSETDTGDFDATGTKALPSFRFTFPDPGDYIVFGQVTLKGDPELNVSGQQFVAFQKISVVDTGVSIAPSPSPTPSMPSPGPSSVAPSPTNGTSANTTAPAASKSSGSVAQDAPSPVKAAVDPTKGPALTDIPAEGTKTNAGKEESKGFNGALLGGILGGCVVVLVLGYVVVMRRKNKNVQGSKLDRGQTPTFRIDSHNHNNDNMDDPEPVAYMSKKTARNSVNQQSLPILGGTSTSSTDDVPMSVDKHDADMADSLDDMNSSYEEGTVTASNKAIATQPRKQSAQQQSRPSDREMAPSSLYDDRDTALYEGPTAKEEREFYQSETWDAAASGHSVAHTYDDRDQSMISFNGSGSRRGFAAPSFTSETIGDDFDDNRITRFNSEASVDSYAFRPSRVSVAESYQSRVSRNSRYSYADSDLDRESGMSMFSDRGTNV